MIGHALGLLVALALLGIGAAAVAAPRAAARQYGFALYDPRALALVRAMGARDLVIGALVGLMAAYGRRDLLALFVAISALVALVDFAVVAADPSGRRSARLLHGGGAAVLLTIALVIAMRV